MLDLPSRKSRSLQMGKDAPAICNIPKVKSSSASSANTCSIKTPINRSSKRSITAPWPIKSTLEIRRFESDKVLEEGDVEKAIGGCDGYLVPGGFGERGWMGKIMTAKYCREKKIPYFGLCLGMQVMCVEFARHVLGLKDANSTEVDPNTPHPVISLLSEQKGIANLGGTMRLGAYTCQIKPDTKA